MASAFLHTQDHLRRGGTSQSGPGSPILIIQQENGHRNLPKANLKEVIPQFRVLLPSEAKRQVLNIILHIPPHMWILKKQISFIRLINRGGDGGAVGGQLKLTVNCCIFCA